ncbi:MAG: MGH1-like glycoside hydrolase domain-containing protein [Terriglobales bacterium]
MSTKPDNRPSSKEHQRLAEPYEGMVAPWRKWGPYVSERSWGTVREDYSPEGCAWEFLTHDMARSKAYRWGEDGIAGICDRYQLLVFALALWNGRDPILKERMFGLSGNEGNHGEDAKEYWFYLDNTPTHSYMKMLYKYPQAEFPYQKLLKENRRRWGKGIPEYELLDTGIFDQDRYFDVFVEYAKAGPEDICIRIEAFNRGPETAELHLLPHLWFRNNWAWTDPPTAEPVIGLDKNGGLGTNGNNKDHIALVADDSHATSLRNLQFPYSLGARYLYAPQGGQPLFTNNENNAVRLYGCADNRKPYVKDAFHRHIVNHEDGVSPAQAGTKSCIHYRQMIPPGKSMVLCLRLTPEELPSPLGTVEEIVARRRAEADEFYSTIHPPAANSDEKAIQRQALAGMLWSKQIYLWDVNRWLEGDNPKFPPPASRKQMRNVHWRHLNSMRILSMPDKWEFPWFAAWDLAFQCITLALVDPEFAKENLWVMLFEQFQHPNGQIPAYEWEFSDLNPPVHAWACWRVYQMEKQRTGKGDTVFLEKCLHKLLMNFAWWVNRVDSEGNNVFEGGFLGLDNIAVVDRGEKFPNGAILEQSDATGWMGFFCLYLMRIALELANQNRVYEGVATKFFEHFIYIGAAMKKMGGRNYQLWDEKEGFFYDVLRYPNGEFHKFRLRSLVGLIPLYAIDVLESEELAAHPGFLRDVEWFIQNRPDLVGDACYTVGDGRKRYVLSIADPNQFERLLQRIWDPAEFLSPYGIRSLSKYHEQHPFQFEGRSMGYEPGEAAVQLKGGNSNWRGPIWFPTSYLLIHSFLRFGDAVGHQFSPLSSGKGKSITPRDMAQEAANRMIAIFKRGADGKRPCFGPHKKFQDDPHWKDYLLFNEYYHGDNGMGLGASHQTGWSGLVANLIDEWRR